MTRMQRRPMPVTPAIVAFSHHLHAADSGEGTRSSLEVEAGQAIFHTSNFPTTGNDDHPPKANPSEYETIHHDHNPNRCTTDPSELTSPDWSPSAQLDKRQRPPWHFRESPLTPKSPINPGDPPELWEGEHRSGR